MSDRSQRRLLTAIPVAGAHLALLVLMLAAPPAGRSSPEPWSEAVTVEFARPPERPKEPEPVKPDDAPARPAARAKATSPRPDPKVEARPAAIVARMARPAPPAVPTLPAAPAAAGDPGVVLGEGALQGATFAGGDGSGGSGSGGGCDMVRRLQDALRRDPDIRRAVSRSRDAIGPAGKAILVWNGQWLRSPGEDGKGLAGVRQAIAMEVAFAPEACRAMPMRGLVVISFDDGPNPPRLAIGGGQWRWSELLSARR